MMKNYMKLFTSVFLCALVSANSLMALELEDIVAPQIILEQRAHEEAEAQRQLIEREEEQELQEAEGFIADEVQMREDDEQYIGEANVAETDCITEQINENERSYTFRCVLGISVIPAAYWLVNGGIKRDMFSVRNGLLFAALAAGATAVAGAIKAYNELNNCYYSICMMGYGDYSHDAMGISFEERAKTAGKELCQAAIIATLSGMSALACLMMRAKFNSAS